MTKDLNPPERKQRETLELTIESIGFEGKAIARNDGFVYFVDGGIPGDVVQAQVRFRKKSYAEAFVTKVLSPSSARVEPRCRYFGTCGGCKWQHLEYAEQCSWKKQHVRDAFERLGKVPFGALHDTLPSAEQFYYRNKMEFSFDDSRWITNAEIASGAVFDRNFALGLHIPGRFDKVLDVEECFLQSEISSRIVNAVRVAAKAHKNSIYQTRTHEGFLRNLVIRTARATGELMVILVTSSIASKADETLIAWFETEFLSAFPDVTTSIHAVSTSKSQLAIGEPRVIKGSGFITEEILGVKFRVSPFSFFQTNTNQANALFRITLDYAGLTEGENSQLTVWDLYCGAGSITLPAAQRAKFVAGIELSEHSIADARSNAAANGITNVEFYAEDMQKAVKRELLEKLPVPDVIIVDPPRAGLHPDVVAKLAEIAPPVIVYVSCNPATQARDCAMLAERYAEQYTVEQIQPVDMFPHTYHIESVARLVRKLPSV